MDDKNEALYFKLSEESVVECEEIAEGIILDYDEQENVVGIEISNNGSPLSTEELSNIEFELPEN
ncbi:MAG: DUF2283 domain-containing protein [Candidatus Thermoplasmatota archaeon]